MGLVGSCFDGAFAGVDQDNFVNVDGVVCCVPRCVEILWIV